MKTKTTLYRIRLHTKGSHSSDKTVASDVELREEFHLTVQHGGCPHALRIGDRVYVDTNATTLLCGIGFSQMHSPDAKLGRRQFFALEKVAPEARERAEHQTRSARETAISLRNLKVVEVLEGLRLS